MQEQDLFLSLPLPEAINKGLSMSLEMQSTALPVSPMMPQDEGPDLPTPPTGKVFDKPKEITTNPKKRDIPEGLWTRCDHCGQMITNKELGLLLMVCPKCHFHFVATAADRILWLCDEDTFQEINADLVSVDALKFKGVAAYTDKLKSYQKETGLKDAVVTGFCEIEKVKAALAIMDFSFLAASMGSVVGEKITRLIEKATKKKLPVVIVCASGGARMYEGMLSLMQMAKTSAALARHAQAKLPYIAVLTNPTMAGVMASFASLGDVIIAEPQSMIGFAGARVIRETTREELPKGFQTAEFLLEGGLIDMIVHRKQLKGTLASLLEFMS
jgi:acetyl-CoA carboxylase carboxyl transferase subunit beta